MPLEMGESAYLIRHGGELSMPKPYSTDLREGAVEAVESGASRHEAAEMFKMGVSSVIRWCRLWIETGKRNAPAAPLWLIGRVRGFDLGSGCETT